MKSLLKGENVLGEDNEALLMSTGYELGTGRKEGRDWQTLESHERRLEKYTKHEKRKGEKKAF